MPSKKFTSPDIQTCFDLIAEHGVDRVRLPRGWKVCAWRESPGTRMECVAMVARKVTRGKEEVHSRKVLTERARQLQQNPAVRTLREVVSPTKSSKSFASAAHQYSHANLVPSVFHE